MEKLVREEGDIITIFQLYQHFNLLRQIYSVILMY